MRQSSVPTRSFVETDLDAAELAVFGRVAGVVADDVVTGDRLLCLLNDAREVVVVE